jgi:hypothetical protein
MNLAAQHVCAMRIPVISRWTSIDAETIASAIELISSLNRDLLVNL